MHFRLTRMRQTRHLQKRFWLPLHWSFIADLGRNEPTQGAGVRGAQAEQFNTVRSAVLTTTKWFEMNRARSGVMPNLWRPCGRRLPAGQIAIAR